MTDEEYARLAERTIRDLREQGIEVSPDGGVNSSDAATVLGMEYRALKRMREKESGPRYFRVGERGIQYLIDDLLRWKYYGEVPS